MHLNWQEHVEHIKKVRHWLHSHPELTWQEEQTAAYVRSQLNQWNIPWRASAKYGTVATLASQSQGKHLAFRSDMDALPIQEPDTNPSASLTENVMHACGHDGHMAALLGVAKWLKENESALPGPVSLLFQPAEEGGHGAREMIADGALETVDTIFGWHNWPGLPLGRVLCPEGPVMSGNGTFHVRIQGKGGHASQPDITRDPLLAASALVLNLQQIVSRRLPPQAAAVVSVTSIDAKNAVTVIPDSVYLEGSIRLSEPQWREPINDAIRSISKSTASAYDVTADVEIRARYEATINHPEPASRFRDALRSELGEKFDQTSMKLPLMASEDFSYYLNEIPGAFAIIGMAEEEGECSSYSAPCHSPDYCFNDKVIEQVMRVFCRLAGVPILQ